MAGRKVGGGQESQGVEVALAPEELELDPMAMTQKYEEHVREQQAQVAKEDFSDMVAEHAAKQKVPDWGRGRRTVSRLQQWQWGGEMVCSGYTDTHVRTGALWVSQTLTSSPRSLSENLLKSMRPSHQQ